MEMSYAEIYRRLRYSPPPPPPPASNVIIKHVRQVDRPPPPVLKPRLGLTRAFVACEIAHNLSRFDQLCTVMELMMLREDPKPWDVAIFEALRSVHRIAREDVCGLDLAPEMRAARIDGVIALRLISRLSIASIGIVLHRSSPMVSQMFCGNIDTATRAAIVYGLGVPVRNRRR
jgi:hypothetical protein